MFQHFDYQNVPFAEFAEIVEYVLFLPETSVPVGDIFAMAKKICKAPIKNNFPNKKFPDKNEFFLHQYYNTDYNNTDSIKKYSPSVLR